MRNIIIGIAVFFLITLGVYSYYFVQDEDIFIAKDQEKTAETKDQAKEQEETTESKEQVEKQEENFDENDWEWLVLDSKMTLSSQTDDFVTSIDIDNFSLLSQNNWLNQRINVDNMYTEYDLGSENEELELSNLDVIADEEIVYIKLSWNDNLENYLEEIWENFWINVITNWEYIKIDNSQQMMELLWEFAQLELAEKIIKGLSTSNYDAYFQKYWVYQDLRDKIFVEWFYKYLFEEVEDQWNRTYLRLKEENCEIAANVYEIAAEADARLWMIPFDEEMCNESLSEINSDFIENQLYVTQDDDIETITYEWVFNFSMSYSQGDLISYELTTPVWLNSEYSENVLTVTFNSPFFMKQEWHDVNFFAELEKENDWIFWNIEALYEYENFGRGVFEAEIEDNEIVKYETAWNFEEWSEVLLWSGEWNNNQGDLTFSFEEDSEEVVKYNYEYEDKIRNILIKIEENEFDSTFEIKDNEVQLDWRIESENVNGVLDMNILYEEFSVTEIDGSFRLEVIINSPFRGEYSNFITGEIDFEDNNLNSKIEVIQQDEDWVEEIGEVTLSWDLEYNDTDLEWILDLWVWKIDLTFVHQNSDFELDINIQHPRWEEYYLKSIWELDLSNKIDLQTNWWANDEDIWTIDSLIEYTKEWSENIIKKDLVFEEIWEKEIEMTGKTTWGYDEIDYKIPDSSEIWKEIKEIESPLVLPNFSSEIINLGRLNDRYVSLLWWWLFWTVWFFWTYHSDFNGPILVEPDTYKLDSEVLSVLSSSSSAPRHLEASWICEFDKENERENAGISFNAIENEYALSCWSGEWWELIENDFETFAEKYNSINYKGTVSSWDDDELNEENTVYYEIN